MSTQEEFKKRLNKRIENELKSHLNNDDLIALDFLMLSIGRVWFNDALKDYDAIHNMDNPKYIKPVSHIKDWLIVAIKNNDEWISNVDELGRPKKLMKFSSVEQIVQEADKDMIKKAQQNYNLTLNEDDEILVEKFENGYCLVKLVSPKALDKESSYMQHCIGNGAYDEKVLSEKFIYLSLRDQNNKPHATIELAKEGNEWQVCQAQGKQNALPLQKYFDMFIPYFEKNKIVPEPYSISDFPYIVDKNKKWHSINNLPDAINAPSFVCNPEKLSSLCTRHPTETINLPDKITFDQRLDVIYYNIDKFSSYIYDNNCVESINFYDCVINSFPKKVSIDGRLYLNSCILNDAPLELKSTKNVYMNLVDCKKFPKLIITPHVFIKNLNLDINDTTLKAKKVDIINSKIEELPILKNTTSLKIENTPIFNLSSGLNLKNLFLYDTNITELPNDIKISEEIHITNLDGFDFPDGVKDDVVLKFYNKKKISSGLSSSMVDYKAITDMTTTVGEYRAARNNNLKF